MEDELAQIESQLSDHFKREEDTLNECCRKIEDTDLTSALIRLRIDHNEILFRIDDLRSEAKEIVMVLSSGAHSISRSFEFGVHITETRVFLEKHADQETVLFERLRNRLSAV